MLKSEPHLSWLGMDMHTRWRRRVAVVATYLAFLAVAVEVGNGGWGHPYIATIVLTGAILSLGIFSRLGPVKSFEVPAPKGEFMSKYVLVTGLDDLARYRYDVANYEAASEAQKSNLLQTYHVGTRLYPRKASLDEQEGLSEQWWLDEREKQERVVAERWARRWLMTMLAFDVGRYLRLRAPVGPGDVVADLVWLWILATTLAPARVLWTERDPRDMPGEIELVAGQVGVD